MTFLSDIKIAQKPHKTD